MVTITQVLSEHFYDVRPLAKGTQAQVFLGVPRGGPPLQRPRAIKCMPKLRKDVPPQRWVPRWQNERDTWRRLHNAPGIVPLIDIIENDQYITFVSEYCEAGTLEDLLMGKPPNRPIQWPISRRCSMQRNLLVGLNSCHSKNICHGDIKASNIFVRANGDFCIGDFGCSQMATGPTTGLFINIHTCGTMEYMAPEVWKKNEYGTSADLWSLGRMLQHLGIDTPESTQALMQQDPEARMPAKMFLDKAF